MTGWKRQWSDVFELLVSPREMRRVIRMGLGQVLVREVRVERVAQLESGWFAIWFREAR